MAIPPSEVAARFFGQNVTHHNQPKNDGSDPPISGANGDPNSAPSPGDIGIDLPGDSVFGLFHIEHSSGTAMTIRPWILVKGRDTWSELVNGEFEVKQGRPASEEIKIRGLDRLYFERVDTNGGDWTAELDELR